jgi:hypothetical protein
VALATLGTEEVRKKENGAEDILSRELSFPFFGKDYLVEVNSDEGGNHLSSAKHQRSERLTTIPWGRKRLRAHGVCQESKTPLANKLRPTCLANFFISLSSSSSFLTSAVDH